MSYVRSTPTELAPFTNESYYDFTQPRHAEGMRAALAKVRAEFGREYPLLIAGERRETGDLLRSVNPSNPSELSTTVPTKARCPAK